MVNKDAHIRVLYSFPHKLGGGRIQTTAWEQVRGITQAGAEVLVCPGFLQVALPGNPVVKPTLSRGRLRLPYKLLGTARTCLLHDRIVARRLRKLAGKIDIVHLWPLAASQTARTAAEMGIPTVLERPNAHTAFAYQVVQDECQRLGIALPPGHEHAFDRGKLVREEEEYQLTDYLLCPSDFVMKTFVDRGFPHRKLVRHSYGMDPQTFYPSPSRLHDTGKLFTMIFVGVCAVRKGLHFALEAWLKSPASRTGQFLIAGEFIPSYEEKLRPWLAHESIRLLGHRDDVAELMRNSDVLVLPTLEEGSALVTSEARASGCVLLVSEASGAICRHGENALEHRVGDVETLARHITQLYEDPALLHKLRANSLSTVDEITWTAAGVKLLDLYREVIASYRAARSSTAVSEPAVSCNHVSVS
jgi:glycosyltransferase involved in cell wall biosynthesis